MNVWILVFILLSVAVSLPPFLGKRFFRNRVAPHQTDPGELNIPFQEVWIPTRNRRRLYGWWMEDHTAGPSPVIILVHGWGRNTERMLPYIKNLVNRGYHLIAFDSRNHGSSDPDQFSSMLKFAEDIEAVITWLSKNPRVNSQAVGLVGLSIGGAASLYAASQNPSVRAVVTVGAFADPVTMMDLEFRKHHIPRFPLPWLMYRYIEYLSRKRIRTFAPVNNMQIVQAPVLLVHNTDDATVPYSEALRLKKAGDPERVELWTQEGYGHSNGHEHPDFWPRITTFFYEHLKG